jgi:hypothetical protein
LVKNSAIRLQCRTAFFPSLKTFENGSNSWAATSHIPAIFMSLSKSFPVSEDETAEQLAPLKGWILVRADTNRGVLHTTNFPSQA